MIKVVTAPFPYQGEAPSIFLAGGISKCPDWQSEMIDLLSDVTDLNLVVVNPRRPGDMMKTGHEAAAQIAWEENAIRRVNVVTFWFPKESICPIALFELGNSVGRRDNILVGTDPAYPRRFDVEQQLGLAWPGKHTALSLAVLRDMIVEAFSRFTTTRKVA